MTKEAIDYIIPAIKNYWNDKICDDIIKTLAQEPCEDAISRKWIKEALHNFYYGLNHIPTEEDIQRYIEVAPSVTPQPKIESEGIIEEIICGLEFTVDMFLYNPSTGETYNEPRNDMNKITIDACNGAIKILKEIIKK